MTFCCSVGSTPGEQLMLVFLMPSDEKEIEFAPVAPGTWLWPSVTLGGVSVAMVLNLMGMGVLLYLVGDLVVKIRGISGGAK